MWDFITSLFDDGEGFIKTLTDSNIMIIILDE
jgi:hypothetical protein